MPNFLNIRISTFNVCEEKEKKHMFISYNTKCDPKYNYIMTSSTHSFNKEEMNFTCSWLYIYIIPNSPKAKTLSMSV
jgi:hypothetical protein